MKSIATFVLIFLVLLGTMTLSYAEASPSASGFSIKEFLINVLLTLVIWRTLMTIIKALRRPKKQARRKYRKKTTKHEENPVLLDE